MVSTVSHGFEFEGASKSPAPQTEPTTKAVSNPNNFSGIADFAGSAL